MGQVPVLGTERLKAGSAIGFMSEKAVVPQRSRNAGQTETPFSTFYLLFSLLQLKILDECRLSHRGPGIF